MVLTTVGSLGLTAHEITARLGFFVKRQREVPFGTLVSLTEFFAGVGLAWHWLGPYAALAVLPLGMLIALLLTVAIANHVQVVWISGQAILLYFGVGSLLQIASGF
jgi:hypothetical protein